MFEMILFILSLVSVVCSIILMVISDRRMTLCAQFLEDFDSTKEELQACTADYNDLVSRFNELVRDANELIKENNELCDEVERRTEERNNLLIRLGYSWEDKPDE